jgi:hypothetical protein
MHGDLLYVGAGVWMVLALPMPGRSELLKADLADRDESLTGF